MSIDKSGDWWTGSTAAEIDEYLSAYTAEYYPANRFEHSRCGCGCERFGVEVDDEEGCARRTCISCARQFMMLDSAEHWSDASAETCECPCGARQYELAVGYSHGTDGSIRWVTIGARCTSCGVLGALTGWKIDYEPSAHLYSAA